MSVMRSIAMLGKIVRVICVIIAFIFVLLVTADIQEERKMLRYLQSLQGKPFPANFKDVLSNEYNAEIESYAIHRSRLFGKIIRTVGFNSSVTICFDKRSECFSPRICFYFPRLKAFKL